MSPDQPPPPPKPEPWAWSFAAAYAIPLSSSLVVFALLWNLLLICKVQFARNKPITKLTFKPYILSFCFLVAQLIEAHILVYENEQKGHHKRHS